MFNLKDTTKVISKGA